MPTRSTSRPPWLEHDAPRAGGSSGRRTSNSSTDFEFLNDKFAPPISVQASFYLFQKLPLELRRHIWMFNLPQQRILQVTVAAELASASAHQCQKVAPYQGRNHLGNIVSGADYRLYLRSTSTHSTLLYVNHEANAVVHSVYRVHVPITQQATSFNVPRLRFCPERDTILITIERDEDKAYFADFVHDALAYDPKTKGVLHMAITGEQCAVHLPIALHNLHSRAQAALACTLKGLRSVSLVRLIHTKTRQMFSSLLKHFLINEIPPTERVRLNRAYPLWSSTASYSILPVDPRPVSRYLDLVDCGWDPRILIRAWRMLESAYDVSPTPAERIRVIIATTDPDESLEIATTSQACWYRKQEELLWDRKWQKWGFLNLHHPDIPNPDNDEDFAFSRAQNAIGFWSIPLEAFGPVPEVPYDDYQWLMTRICDFTAFESQIQLGLFTIE